MKVIYNNKEVANTTLNYNELFNKPLLNSHELIGNTSLNDIGVYSKPQVDNLIASTRSIKVVSALPTPLVPNTMYYVGPDSNNLYHIYLVDSSLTLIDLGMSQDAVYVGGNGIDISSDNEISVEFDNDTLMLSSEGELYVREATNNVSGVVKYDNTSIKKDSSGKIYVPTTKSGDRYDVYPYTASNGVTDVGKHVNFHITDDSTAWLSSLRSVESTGSGLTKGDLYVQNSDTASRSGTVLTSGMIYHNTLGSTSSDTSYPVDAAATRNLTNILIGGIATTIPDNADLNTPTYTKVGHYRGGATASVATYQNCPTNISFRMTVENLRNNDTSTVDTVSDWTTRTRTLRNTANETWVQAVDKNGSTGVITYGPWIKVLTSGAINHNTINGTDSTVPVDQAAVQHLTKTLTAAGATSVPSNADLNTITYCKPGKYYNSDYNSASTVANNPSHNAFSMVVENLLATSEVISNWMYLQRTLTDNFGDIYVQRITVNGSQVPTFYAWKKVLTSSDLSSRNQLRDIISIRNLTTSTPITTIKGNTYTFDKHSYSKGICIPWNLPNNTHHIKYSITVYMDPATKINGINFYNTNTETDGTNILRLCGYNASGTTVAPAVIKITGNSSSVATSSSVLPYTVSETNINTFQLNGEFSRCNGSTYTWVGKFDLSMRYSTNQFESYQFEVPYYRVHNTSRGPIILPSFVDSTTAVADYTITFEADQVYE